MKSRNSVIRDVTIPTEAHKYTVAQIVVELRRLL